MIFLKNDHYRFGYFDAKSTRPLPTQAGHRDPTEINSIHGHLPPITRPEKRVCKQEKGVFWFYFYIFALNFCKKNGLKQYQKCIFQYRFVYFDAKSTRPLPTQAGHRDSTKINSIHVHLPPITRPEKSDRSKKRVIFFLKKSEIFKNISRKSRFAKKQEFIVVIF